METVTRISLFQPTCEDRGSIITDKCETNEDLVPDRTEEVQDDGVQDQLEERIRNFRLNNTCLKQGNTGSRNNGNNKISNKEINWQLTRMHNEARDDGGKEGEGEGDEVTSDDDEESLSAEIARFERADQLGISDSISRYGSESNDDAAGDDDFTGRVTVRGDINGYRNPYNSMATTSDSGDSCGNLRDRGAGEGHREHDNDRTEYRRVERGDRGYGYINSIAGRDNGCEMLAYDSATPTEIRDSATPNNRRAVALPVSDRSFAGSDSETTDSDFCLGGEVNGGHGRAAFGHLYGDYTVAGVGLRASQRSELRASHGTPGHRQRVMASSVRRRGGGVITASEPVQVDRLYAEYSRLPADLGRSSPPDSTPSSGGYIVSPGKTLDTRKHVSRPMKSGTLPNGRRPIMLPSAGYLSDSSIDNSIDRYLGGRAPGSVRTSGTDSEGIARSVTTSRFPADNVRGDSGRLRRVPLASMKSGGKGKQTISSRGSSHPDADSRRPFNGDSLAPAYTSRDYSYELNSIYTD